MVITDAIRDTHIEGRFRLDGWLDGPVPSPLAMNPSRT
jgi:hypothetical protein